MTFASNVFEVAGDRGSYLYAFHHLCKLYGVKAGTPADLAALPARLQADEKLRGHLQRMLASMRGADGMNELDLLTTVALAFGGPAVAFEGQVEVPDDLFQYFEPIPAEQFQAAARGAQQNRQPAPAPSAQAHPSESGAAPPAPVAAEEAPTGPRSLQAPESEDSGTGISPAAAVAEELRDAKGQAEAVASSMPADPEVIAAVERLDSTREALERRLEQIERLVGGIARDLKGQAIPAEERTAVQPAPATPLPAVAAEAKQPAEKMEARPDVAPSVPKARPVVPAMARLDLLLPHAEFVPSEGADALADVTLAGARASGSVDERAREAASGRTEALVLDLPPASAASAIKAKHAAEEMRPAEPPAKPGRIGRNAPQSLSLTVDAPLASTAESRLERAETKEGKGSEELAAAPANKGAASLARTKPPMRGTEAAGSPAPGKDVPAAAPEPQPSSRVFLVDEAPVSRRPMEPAFEVPTFSAATESASSRFGVVMLWILVIVIFTACGVGAAWYYRHQQAAGINAPSAAAPAPSSASTEAPAAPESGAAGSTAPAPSPARQPQTPSGATPIPANSASGGALAEQVSRVLNDWADAAAHNDVTAETSYYAPHLDRYFQKRNVSRDYVRFDKSYFRQRGRQMQSFRISNLHYLFPAQDDAVVTLTKTWSFRWGGENIRQSTRSRLWLHRSQDGWKITGEQDLTSPVEEQ